MKGNGAPFARFAPRTTSVHAGQPARSARLRSGDAEAPSAPARACAVTSAEALLERTGLKRATFEDFRANGMLLPCREQSVLQLGLALHRGPHPHYSELVWQRVGQIEREWSSQKKSSGNNAVGEAWMRLSLLQGALRRRLLSPGPRLMLNTRDPLGRDRDFTVIDRMAESLWIATSA